MSLGLLPPEILIRILFYCDIHSILTVGQTNRNLHALTNDRTVWLDVLSIQSRVFHIPLQQFRLDMNPSVKVLQQIVTGFGRFVSRMTAILPDSDESQSLAPVTCVHMPFSFDEVTLCEGGRWLIGLRAGKIELWDLEKSSMDDWQPECTHIVSDETDWSGSKLFLTSASFTQDTQRLAIAARMTSSQAGSKLYAFEMTIYPSPSFILLGWAQPSFAWNPTFLSTEQVMWSTGWSTNWNIWNAATGQTLNLDLERPYSDVIAVQEVLVCPPPTSDDLYHFLDIYYPVSQLGPRPKIVASFGWEEEVRASGLPSWFTSVSTCDMTYTSPPSIRFIVTSKHVHHNVVFTLKEVVFLGPPETWVCRTVAVFDAQVSEFSTEREDRILSVAEDMWFLICEDSQFRLECVVIFDLKKHTIHLRTLTMPNSSLPMPPIQLDVYSGKVICSDTETDRCCILTFV
ncbi:hypothetical protein DL96DRAFT_1811315 [Flagelloscypha sp. PMI_526]|nr:hypothetical protein DL96DRAFT_1811315 [Flagelloscypha sp. PMI_526]